MRKYLIPLCFAIAFFVVGIATNSDYGMNWDTPYRLLRGQGYFHYMTTGQKVYPDNQKRISPLIFKPGEFTSRINFLSGEGPKRAELPLRPLPRLEYEKDGLLDKRISFYKHPVWGADYQLNAEPGHLPLPELSAVLFNRILWGGLGLLGDIQSYQVFFVLVSALGVLIVGMFAYDVSKSKLAGIVASLSLALYPLFFAESHFNIKDPLQAVFFAGSVWAFWRWVMSDRLKWWGMFVVFLTLAVGIKWNIGFLPFIIIPWLFSIRKTEEFKRWFKPKKLLLLGALTGAFLIIFMWAIWPSSWSSPLVWLSYLPAFYLASGTGMDNIQPGGFVLPGGFNIYLIVSFLIQTPEILLIFLSFGLAWVFTKRGEERLKIGCLLLLWLLVPLIRTAIPGMRNYSGLRQIMEVVPALAVLSGLGANYLVSLVRSKIQNSGWVSTTLVFVTCFFLIVPIVRLHPNQNLYFNKLIGGISGAQEHKVIDVMMSYGNVYKQAVEWLNLNAEKGSNLAILEGYDYAASPLWLRPDVSISPGHFSGFERSGEYIFVLKNDTNQPYFTTNYPKTFLSPVHEIKVDGVAFLSIYKNDEQFVKAGLQKESTTSDFKIKTVSRAQGKHISINLNNTVLITRITLKNASSGCNDKQDYYFVDETIVFEDSGVVSEYNLLERKTLNSEGSIEYYFPGILAKNINITSRSRKSCFLSGTVESVSYIAK